MKQLILIFLIGVTASTVNAQEKEAPAKEVKPAATEAVKATPAPQATSTQATTGTQTSSDTTKAVRVSPNMKQGKTGAASSATKAYPAKGVEVAPAKAEPSAAPEQPKEKTAQPATAPK